MDYDAYRAQLIEKEAYFIDDSIGKLYRRADLESHPEKIPNLLKLFNKWLANKYKSYESEDGWDVEYLCIADEMKYHGIAITAIRALKKYFRIGEKNEIADTIRKIFSNRI